MPENEKSRENVSDKTIDVNAKTVEEAIEQGLAQLNLAQDEVEIEIVSEGKRGVFGLGAEDAHVRLTPKRLSEGISPSFETAEGTTPSEEVFSTEEAPPASEVSDTQTEIDDSKREQDVEDIAEEYLKGLLDRMGVQAQVTRGDTTDLAEPGEEPPLVLDITGQDLGILIGRRSETLRALQYMLRLMVTKKISRWYPVVIDVESYRVRRRRSLRQLAQKMAKRAVTSHRRVVLEAMPAYERRIIHLALRNHPDVYTKSVGIDESRKVTIIPK